HDALPISEKPNATMQTNRALIKWTAWILPSTPLPTPQDPTNAAVVGLFQGAEYQSNGWYRPKLDCKMRTLGVPFCEVCSEALVKSVYAGIRPIDMFSPSTTNLTVLGTQAVEFSVTPMQPSSHALSVQSSPNNVAVSGATNSAFQLLPKAIGNGTHAIR